MNFTVQAVSPRGYPSSSSGLFCPARQEPAGCLSKQTMNALLEKVREAAASGILLPSSAENIANLLSGSQSPVTAASISELVEARNWAELDNRFFRTLAFGTGGLRGKSIGAVITKTEARIPQPLGRAGVFLRWNQMR
jgi:hypothetical protein